jgi:hypothetical protein
MLSQDMTPKRISNSLEFLKMDILYWDLIPMTESPMTAQKLTFAMECLTAMVPIHMSQLWPFLMDLAASGLEIIEATTVLALLTIATCGPSSSHLLMKHMLSSTK